MSSDESVEHSRSDGDEINATYILQLQNIQKNISTNENITYSFEELFNLFYRIKISDISTVQPILEATIKMMKSNINSDLHPMIQYGILYSIYTLFDSLIRKDFFKDILDLTLDDPNLRTNDTIKQELLRFDLLNSILHGNLLSKPSSILLEDDEKLKIISQIAEILTRSEKRSVFKLFKIIESNNDCIDFIVTIFPYIEFKDLNFSMIKYWIHLIEAMIKSDIHLTIIIDDKPLEFKSTSEFDIGVVLIMNERNNLSLSNDSKFTFQKSKDQIKFVKDNDKLMFYRVLELAKQKRIKTEDYRSPKSILSKCYKDGMLQYNEKADYEQFNDQIVSLKKLFFENDQKIINLIWNIVFTMTENDIENLSLIINPIESRILLTALKMFKNINSNEHLNLIVSWSNWAVELDSFIDPISMLYFDIVEKYFDDDTKFSNLVNNSRQGLSILESSPDNDNIFWQPRDLTEKCRSVFNHLNKLNEEKEKNKERIKKSNILRRKFNLLKNQLIRIESKYVKMRNDIFKLINEMPFTDANYDHINLVVTLFLEETQIKNSELINTPINWPKKEQLRIPTKNEIKNKDENIKLFESLIYYSSIKECLKQIENNENIIPNLRKLSDFKVMQNPTKILFNDFILNHDREHNGLILDHRKNAEYTLDASLIFSLYNINPSIITKPNFISTMINSYIKREICSKEEIDWIYMKMGQILPNLSILVPIFPYNALVFLVVNKDSENCFIPGPLFNKYLNKEFYKKEGELMFRTDFTSFSNAAKSIAKNALSFFSVDNELPVDYDQMKNTFFERSRIHKEMKKISREFFILFTIADSLDNWTQQELVFDDLDFLSTDFKNISEDFNYINDQKCLIYRPLLVHWLSINDYCAKQLKKFYKNNVEKPNEIPFWVVCLRILSSQNCLRIGEKLNSNL